MLFDSVQHDSSGGVLKSSLEIEGDLDSGRVGFGEVLDGLDHLVGSVQASHPSGSDARLEGKSARERHHEQLSVPPREFGEWCDLTCTQALEDSIRESGGGDVGDQGEGVGLGPEVEPVAFASAWSACAVRSRW